jgi:hypothetical protein
LYRLLDRIENDTQTKLDSPDFGAPVVGVQVADVDGFLLADKKAGPFQLEVGWIKVKTEN